MRKQIFIFGMILLLANMFLINAEISSEMSDKIVEVTYNGTVYTFPTYNYYCSNYIEKDICSQKIYEDYKQAEINTDIQQKAELEKQRLAIADANLEKSGSFNIWTWIVDSIKSLLGLTTQHEKNFQEMCAKNPEYSWCKGGTI